MYFPKLQSIAVIAAETSGMAKMQFLVPTFSISCHQSVYDIVQGAVLTSSDRGGIRIQYSRNPFGKKRDYDGSFINTPTAATYTAPSYEGQAVAAPAYAGTAAAPAAYGSGDYSAPATAPGVEAQQTNGQPASYEATAQPGN